MVRTAIFVLAAALGMAGLSGGAALAALGTCDSSNGGGNKYIQLTSVAANDSDHVVCQSSNPDYSGPAPFLETFFGEQFTLAFKSEELANWTTGLPPKEKGDDTVTFKIFSKGAPSGIWELNPVPATVVDIVIGIKQGATYAGFRVDSTSGTWATANSANHPLGTDISHVDIWYRIAPVPVPAMLPVLALGLIGAGIAYRRRTARPA